MKLVHSDALPADSVPCVHAWIITDTRPDYPEWLAGDVLDQLRDQTTADVVYWNIAPDPDEKDAYMLHVWAEPDESGVRARAELADAVRAAFPNLWKKEA